MPQVLLCAGPGLLVIRKDGQLFYRRQGQPDSPVPYAPDYYPAFLQSAQQKHGLTPVIGPGDEEAPCVPDDAPMPLLRRERLPSGEEVYRMAAAEVPIAEQGSSAGHATIAIRGPGGHRVS